MEKEKVAKFKVSLDGQSYIHELTLLMPPDDYSGYGNGTYVLHEIVDGEERREVRFLDTRYVGGVKGNFKQWAFEELTAWANPKCVIESLN